MKRTAALLLSFIMLMGISANAWVTIPLEGVVKNITDYDRINHTPIKVEQGKTVAHYFVSTEPVKKYQFYCPSYSDSIGSFTASLYKWAGSYDATLKTEPLAVKRFVDFVDNHIGHYNHNRIVDNHIAVVDNSILQVLLLF